METQNYTEIIQAGRRAEIKVIEGFVLDFYNIALVPSNDNMSEVKIYLCDEDNNKVLLCILSERLGIYQDKIELEVTEMTPMTIEVIGKGVVMMTGITYIPDVFEGCSCDEEGCCCGDMDEDLIDDEEENDMDEE